MMRTCRICLKTDILNEMISCFKQPELILDLHFLSNVAIVEINGDEAKICRRCAKNVKQAADFKRLCIESDKKRKQNSDERFLWFESLQKLKTPELADTTESIDITPISQENIDKNFELDEIVMEINSLIAEMDNYENPIEVTKSNPLQNNQPIDFIEFLNYEQLKELSNHVSEVLESEIFKSNTEVKC